MKRTVITMAAVGALALLTNNAASASDQTVAPSHADLAHRNADRQQTHETAHSIGITRRQDGRLHQTLRHQARDDQRDHQSARPGVPAYRYATPRYRSAPMSYGYRAPFYRNSRRNFGYSAYGNRYARPAYGGSGLSISTPGFSFELGY